MNIRYIAVFTLLGIIGTATNGKAGQPGYEFLRTYVGARPAAMGGAFLSVTGDVHSVYYNPAALASLNTRQLTFSYLNSFLDFQSGFLAYSYQHEKFGHFGVGTHFENYGDFTETDEAGNEGGKFSAGDLLVMGDYAFKFSEDFYLGVSFKFIHSTLASYTSTAVAGDFGLIYRFPDQDLQIGFGIFNFGTVTSAFVETKDALPLNFRVGLSKKLAHLPLLLSVEGFQYQNENFHFIVGGEFTVTPFLFLRLGYNSIGRDQKIGSSSQFAGVSIGTGITLANAVQFKNTFWQRFSFDYALTSAGAIGRLNRISVGFRL